jgi:hypothetical protein
VALTIYKSGSFENGRHHLTGDANPGRDIQTHTHLDEDKPRANKIRTPSASLRDRQREKDFQVRAGWQTPYVFRM